MVQPAPRPQPLTRLALAALVLAGVVATPAHAEGWSSFTTAQGNGVQTCPAGTPGGQDFFCISLICPAPDQPLHWEVRYAGPSLGAGPLPFRVTVDRQFEQVLDLMQRPDPVAQVYVQPFDLQLHGQLLDQLSQGHAAHVGLGFGAGLISYPVPLAGSSRAIATLSGLCPGPTTHVVPDPAHPTGYGGDGWLTAALFTQHLLGRELSWTNSGGRAVTTFHPDGRLSGRVENGGTTRINDGTWTLQDDGQVCWRTDTPGCFRFQTVGDRLHVFRSDGNRGLDLGEVQVH